MKKYFQIIVLMLLGFQATSISGQKVSFNFEESVPLDESITYGKLHNGLTYYIKPVLESQEKINLRFYIKAGINHQDPDQLNMAHFVEHMAFKSSEHFPNGIRYGLKTRKGLNAGQQEVGATAGADLSEYRFDALWNNKEALKTGLLWFKDIATRLHFKNEEIDSERGVLVQELMLRSSDDIQETFSKFKLLAQMSPCFENYSNFMEHHETFDPERLKQFYYDWYRPDLMGIVVTGKIKDVAALEKQIAVQFSNIATKENPRELPRCEALFFNRPSQFKVVEKKSEHQPSHDEVEVELLFRDKETLVMLPSLEGVKRLNKINLLLEIINNRLREAKEYGSFFDIHMLHTFKMQTTPSSFKALLSSQSGSEKEALQTFIRVLEQVSRYGVTESEFNQVKRKRINQLGKVDLDKSIYWRNEIRNHFVHNEALPSDKPGVIRDWLLDYQSSEFIEFIKGINFEMPDIGIIAPTNHSALTFKESEVRSWIAEVNQGAVVPYVLPEMPSSLMSCSDIKELEQLPYEDKGVGDSGAREIVLANDVRVFLKSFKPSPSPYQNKIMFHGFNNRGALDFPAADYFSAVNSPLFIKHSGVGKFDKFELQRHMSTNSLFMTGINLYVDNQEAGIKLDADLEDVEKMLQLVYLLLSKPREDSLAFQDWKVQQSLNYQNSLKVEQQDIRYNIRKFIGDNSGVSRGSERHHGLDETDMIRGFEIYKELFGDPRDFTFMITGDFPMDSVIPLVNKYLGNLPSFQPVTLPNHNKDIFVPKLVGPVFTQFKFPDSYTKTNYIYMPTYMIPSKKPDTWKEKLHVRVLGMLLNTKVKELRRERGYALYMVGASGKYDRNMRQYEFGATFDCTPKEYPLLRQEFRKIINELKTENVSKEMLGRIVYEMQGMYTRGVNTHRYIHGKLYYHLRFEEPWTNEKEFIFYLETITPDDMLKAAQKYFKEEHLYEFLMKN